MDDLLTHGHIQEEQNFRLTQILDRLKGAKLVLNKDKYPISPTSMKFIVNLIDKSEIIEIEMVSKLKLAVSKHSRNSPF